MISQKQKLQERSSLREANELGLLIHIRLFNLLITT